jgi:photosystem II stability/assembly factor-like uncharacterized protein
MRHAYLPSEPEIRPVRLIRRTCGAANSDASQDRPSDHQSMKRLGLAISGGLLASCVFATTTPSPTSAVAPSPTQRIEPTAAPSVTESAAPAAFAGRTSFGAVDFISRSNGWVAIDDAVGRALLRTTDGGEHWERLALARGSTYQLKFVDADRGWLVGSIDDPPGCVGASCSLAVLRTTDGGRTWEKTFVSGEFDGLAAVDAQHAWVVQPAPACRASFDDCATRVLGTSDGITWTQLAVVDGATTSLNFVDANTGWMALHTSVDASILATHDGGRTWTRQFHASGSQPLPQVSFVNTLDGWALESDLAYCAMGGCVGYTLYSTTDGGASWTTLQRPEIPWWGPTPPLASAAGFLGAPQFTSSTSGWIRIDTGAGPGAGGVLITADGGRTWRRSNGDSGTWSVGALTPVDGKVAVATVHAYEGPATTTFLARTIDGALTWQRLSLNERFPVALPSGCRVLSTVLGTDQVEWRVDCGAAMNASARGTLGPALSADGWRLCGSGLASATWSKTDSQLRISEGSGVPGEGFVVVQRSGQCP